MGLPVFVRSGQLAVAELVRAHAVWSARLFRNDRTPSIGDTAASYTQADFSGYSGQQALAYGEPGFQNDRALMTALPLSWVHDGGPDDNLIFGVYVVDGDGELIYAERDPRGPQWITAANPVYSYIGVFTDTSEYQ